jgi:hypothetical protein
MKRKTFFATLVIGIAAANQTFAFKCKFEIGNIVSFAETKEIYKIIDIVKLNDETAKECIYTLGDANTGEMRIPLSDETNLNLI